MSLETSMQSNFEGITRNNNSFKGNPRVNIFDHNTVQSFSRIHSLLAIVSNNKIGSLQFDSLQQKKIYKAKHKNKEN